MGTYQRCCCCPGQVEEEEEEKGQETKVDVHYPARSRSIDCTSTSSTTAHAESCSRSEEVQAAKTWLMESMEKYECGPQVVVVEDKEVQPNCETQFGELQGGKKRRLRDNSSNATEKCCKCESHSVMRGEDKENQQPNCQLGGDASSPAARRSRRRQGSIIGEHCQEEEEEEEEEEIQEEGRHDLGHGHGLHKCSSWSMLFTHVRARSPPPPHRQVVDQLNFGDKSDDTNQDFVVVVVHPHRDSDHEQLQVENPTLDMDHHPQAGDENNREGKKLGNDDGQQLEALANLKAASSAEPHDKIKDDNDTSSEDTTPWSMEKGPAGSWSAVYDDILMSALEKLSKLHEQLRSCSSTSSSSCVEDMHRRPEREEGKDIDDRDDEARRREQQGLQLGEGDVFNSSAGMRSEKEEEDCEEKATSQLSGSGSSSTSTSSSSNSRSHDQENLTSKALGTGGGGDGPAAAADCDCESSLEDQVLQGVGLMDEDEWESCWWVQAGLAPFATQPQTTFGAGDDDGVDRDDDDDELRDRGRAGWDDTDDDDESAAARRIAHASSREEDPEDDDAYAQVGRLMREEDDAEVDRLIRDLEERGLLGIEEDNWRMRDATWDDHPEFEAPVEEDVEELLLRPPPADTATATGGGGGGGWSMRLDLAEMEEDLEAWVQETEEEQRRRQARERQVWSNPCLITATVTLVSLPLAATASGTGGGAWGAGASAEQTSDHEVREPPKEPQQQVREEEEEQAAAAAAAGAAVHAAALGLVLAQCSICLDTPGQGDTVCILPLCRHTFHRDCIGKWFQYSVSCPYCRNNEI